MGIVQINLSGTDLITNKYRFSISGINDFEKIIESTDFISNGEGFGRSKIGAKNLVLSGHIRNVATDELLILNSLLSPNGLKDLVITYADGTKRTGKVEIKNRISGATQRYITCQIYMPDPYWYSTFTDQISLGGTTNAPLILPAVLPWTLGSITGASGNILNQGNTDAYPAITIVGNCSNISISNNTTGESISISGSLADTDTLIIDCRPATCGVWLNGVPRIDLKTTPGWIHCAPWWNTFIFNRTSLQTKKHCTVALQSRWI